ncbi:polyprenyl synthetase family protein [Kutzneria kofuensis]|uniref:polyprenyl synthetase family protein n=1 Tax=Kutzneria kofuensis TaxID=103725 RepID=UPI0035E42818
MHPCDTGFLGLVERALTDYLNRRRTEAALVDENFAIAVDALADFVLGGGKRIRPTFAWWGWRGAGGDPRDAGTDAVVMAVSALELIQACALVHDDLMDASAVRRGSPTVHVAFADMHRSSHWAGTAERFGQASAVLLGDLALAWADDMLRESGLGAGQLHRAYEPWRAMRTEMLAGQYLDVLTQAHADESAEAALRVDRLKTAAYTVERPLHLGAVLAGAGDGLVQGLRQFGVDIGLAFQLRDDLLGVFGDPAVTGKPAGDDLREGKRTLLVSLGLRHAEEQRRFDDATRLRSAIGRHDLDEPAVDVIRDLLVDLGAVAAVEARIAELRDQALATLAATPVAEPAASELARLAVAATRRNH